MLVFMKSCRDIATGPKYGYSIVWEQSILKQPTFPFVLLLEVLAGSDAHVLIAGYEIVIGGWKNSRSEIRIGPQKEALATVFHKSGPLSASENRRFWISLVDEGQISIAVGCGWELWKSTFIVAVDKNKHRRHRLEHVAVSTGFGFEGTWNVHVTTDKPPSEEDSSPLEEICSSSSSGISKTLVSSSRSSLLKRPRRDNVENDPVIVGLENKVYPSDQNKTNSAVARTIARYSKFT